MKTPASWMLKDQSPGGPSYRCEHTSKRLRGRSDPGNRDSRRQRRVEHLAARFGSDASRNLPESLVVGEDFREAECAGVDLSFDARQELSGAVEIHLIRIPGECRPASPTLSAHPTLRVDDTRSLRVYIRSLRQKLEPDPRRPRYLVTEAGLGYRLWTDEAPQTDELPDNHQY